MANFFLKKTILETPLGGCGDGPVSIFIVKIDPLWSLKRVTERIFKRSELKLWVWFFSFKKGTKNCKHYQRMYRKYIFFIITLQKIVHLVTQSLLKDNFVTRRGRARPDGLGQRRDDQEVSDVQRAHWAGCGLRTDDVQALQACLLLVLPHLTRCKFSLLFSLSYLSYWLITERWFHLTVCQSIH